MNKEEKKEEKKHATLHQRCQSIINAVQQTDL